MSDYSDQMTCFQCGEYSLDGFCDDCYGEEYGYEPREKFSLSTLDLFWDAAH